MAVVRGEIDRLNKTRDNIRVIIYHIRFGARQKQKPPVLRVLNADHTYAYSYHVISSCTDPTPRSASIPSSDYANYPVAGTCTVTGPVLHNIGRITLNTDGPKCEPRAKPNYPAPRWMDNSLATLTATNTRIHIVYLLLRVTTYNHGQSVREICKSK